MATQTSDLAGLFKQVYGDDVVNLIPESYILTKDVNFVTAKKLGDKYHQPVIVQQEHGFTYAAPNSGAFALNAAISMKTQDAQVDASQVLLRASMDYETAARAATGKGAFLEATALQMENMMESASKRLELAALYGQSGLGQAASSVNTNATTTVVTLTTGSFTVGIWSGAEGAPIQFWNQSTGALISSGSDAVFTISSVNPATNSLTVTGTATGITALDTFLAGATDADVYFNGSRTSATVWAEMAGLDKIITNTGTLFNINAATYSLWKGNTYSAASGALTFAKLQSGIAAAVARGLTEDVTVMVNPLTWGNLLSDQAALRRYDPSYSSAEVKNGGNSIKFFGQNGSMTIVPHIFVKPQDAFAIPMKRVKRIGSQDLSFKAPGVGDNIFLHIPDIAGFEYRLYTAQSIFLETPSRAVKFTTIVNV
jgi:hypothetical protein